MIVVILGILMMSRLFHMFSIMHDNDKATELVVTVMDMCAIAIAITII